MGLMAVNQTIAAPQVPFRGNLEAVLIPHNFHVVQLPDSKKWWACEMQVL